MKIRLLRGLAVLAGLFLLLPAANSQKVLQLERYGSPRTIKMYIGQGLTYLVREDDVWHQGTIEDLLVERNIIAFEDRYIPMMEITALRYDRPWAKAAGIGLYTFGLAWSGFALVGTLTDGDPTTSYQASDAVVTGVSLGLGWIVSRFMGKKIIKLGDRRRLRMLDLRVGVD